MQSTSEDYVARIVSYVKGAAILDPAQTIPLDESLLETGIFDSFGIVELITFVESEFNLEIPEEDISKEKMGSIRRMANYVHQSKLENA